MMTARNALATLATLAVLALAAGCSTTPNAEMAQAQARADQARAQADQAFYESLKTLAEGAGDGPRTAGIMAAVMRHQSLGQPSAMPRRASLAEQAFPWVSLIKDLFIADRQADAQEHASDNNRDIQLGMFGAMERLSEQIQAPQANTYTTYTASGDGSSNGGAGAWHWEQIGPDSANTGDTTSTSTSTSTTQYDYSVTGSYNPMTSTPLSP